MPSNTFDDEEYRPTAWGQPLYESLTCPSGQKCLVKKPDMIDLLQSGDLLNSTDLLTSIVNSEHITNAQPDAAKRAVAKSMDKMEVAGKLIGDPKNIVNFKQFLNQVVLQTVIKPRLHPAPERDEDRVNGQVYIDSVAYTDKMFIFEYAMKGTADLEPFREEADEPVGSVEPVESVLDETQPVAGAERFGELVPSRQSDDDVRTSAG